MSVQSRGEVTILVTQCNYCNSEDHGGPHHVHQLQFPVLEEGEEDYVDIESFSASTLIRYNGKTTDWMMNCGGNSAEERDKMKHWIVNG